MIRPHGSYFVGVTSSKTAPGSIVSIHIISTFGGCIVTNLLLMSINIRYINQ